MRALARWMFVACLALQLILSGAAPALADDDDNKIRTTLTLRASVGPDRQVSGGGVLMSERGPISGARIVIAVAETAQQSVRTDDTGKFAFSFPLRSDQSQLTLTAVSNGVGNFEDASATTTISLAAPKQPKLTIVVEPTTVLPGALVTVSGRLTDAAGKAVPNAIIRFHVGTKTSPDSTTSTVADGTYSTYLVVPEDATGQDLPVQASFDGSGSLAKTTSPAVVKLIQEEPAQTPTPTPSAAPTAIPTPTPLATTIPTKTTSAHTDSLQANTPAKSGTPWGLLGLVTAAIFGALVTFGLVYRDRIHHRQETSDGLLDDLKAQ